MLRMATNRPFWLREGGGLVWTESVLSVTQEARHEYGRVSVTAARTFYFFPHFLGSSGVADERLEGIGVVFGK